jgi:hypothetical protein
MQYGVPTTLVEYAPYRFKGLASTAMWLEPKSAIRTFSRTSIRMFSDLISDIKAENIFIDVRENVSPRG